MDFTFWIIFQILQWEGEEKKKEKKSHLSKGLWSSWGSEMIFESVGYIWSWRGWSWISMFEDGFKEVVHQVPSQWYEKWPISFDSEAV